MTLIAYSKPGAKPGATPLIPLSASELTAWLNKQDSTTRQWVKSQQFTAEPNTLLCIPTAAGKLRCALVGVAPQAGIWAIAHAPALLPQGCYRLESNRSVAWQTDAALGFALAQYQFGVYKNTTPKNLTLEVAPATNITKIEALLHAITLVRDLINTPANDMGPASLAKAARDIAKRNGARFREIVGADLLKQNYPAIHAVGRAGPEEPRLLDIRWGNANNPLVVLVGKGVTFDTGGLDIKPYAAMKLMKKDMGGAALMLGLMQLVIQADVPVRLRVLIPVVENSISANAFRPQDVIASRKGLTIEIGSTDAEGRVILADALAEGDSEKPALMIDAATLTGAARTALGTELPALFSNRPPIAQAILKSGTKTGDPLWQLPLWQGYAPYVNSVIADVANSPNYGFAGSITAALFLERFVSPTTPWVHIDTYAWNAESKPGRPLGGEALALRALFDYLQTAFT